MLYFEFENKLKLYNLEARFVIAILNNGERNPKHFFFQNAQPIYKGWKCCQARIQNDLSEGAKFYNLFYVDEGIQMHVTKSGPSSARQRNAF